MAEELDKKLAPELINTKDECLNIPIPDQADTFALQIISFFIVGAVQQLPLKVLESCNLWPLPIVQDSGTIDENITSVLRDVASCGVADTNRPFTCLVVPLSMFHLLIDRDVRPQLVFRRKLFEVSLDLRASGVDGRPIFLWLP